MPGDGVRSELVDALRTARRSSPPADHRPGPRESRQRGERDVRGDRELHQPALLAPVLGEQGDAEADRVARAGDSTGRPSSSICPSRGGLRRRSSARSRCGPSRPGRRARGPRPGADRRRCHERIHPRGRERGAAAPRSGVSAVIREVLPEGAPDDQLHHRAACRSARGPRVDDPRVLHHGDAIGELEDLLQAMRDIDDRHAVVPQLRITPRSASTSTSVSETVGSSMISSSHRARARERSSPAAARPARAIPPACGGRRSARGGRRSPAPSGALRQRTRPPRDG